MNYSLKMSFHMDNNTENIPEFIDDEGVYADGFAFWNDVKKYFNKIINIYFIMFLQEYS